MGQGNTRSEADPNFLELARRGRKRKKWGKRRKGSMVKKKKEITEAKVSLYRKRMKKGWQGIDYLFIFFTSF